MAKIRKCKLSWEASDSESVIGYKLYWSKAAEVSYDSKYIKVGNVSEIALPDDVTLSDGPVMFGVTAIDKDGNESDMTTIPEPYQLNVPKAPAGLSLKPLDDYKLVDSTKPESNQLNNVANFSPEQIDNEESLAQAIETNDFSQPARMKYYDDVGYRKTP
jgi:hypothetical protein